MSLFKDMLKSGESLFRDTLFLSYDFQPKILFARENEQQRFAVAIKPLLQSLPGRNLFISGPPGIGKTTACKHVLRELEETTQDVTPLYINCWKENTSFKIYSKLCDDLGFKFLQNKRTTELLDLIKTKLNKTSVVFIFDEVDKLEETDFLYALLEDIYRKSIFLITNYRDSYSELDERIRSRLSPEFLIFRPYNESEIASILKQRRDYAFVQDCWDNDAFKEIVERCTELKDVRIGLYLMREAGSLAEDQSSRKITLQHVAGAMKKVDEFHINPTETLDDDLKNILDLIREKSGQKIGELYTHYLEQGNLLSYKSFQRRILKLTEAKFINTEKTTGKEGNSTIVTYNSNKKLTEY